MSRNDANCFGAVMRKLAPLRTWVLIVGVSTMFAGCASIPLSTMLRMRTFDEAKFAALDPDELRVRVTLSQGFVLDPGRCAVNVNVQSKKRSYREGFTLTEESVAASTVSTSLFASAKPARAWVLRLADSSKPKFRDLQPMIGTGPTDAIDLDVHVAVPVRPQGATSARTRVGLRLSEADGWFTLIDGAELPLGRPFLFGDDAKQDPGGR